MDIRPPLTFARRFPCYGFRGPCGLAAMEGSRGAAALRLPFAWSLLSIASRPLPYSFLLAHEAKMGMPVKESRHGRLLHCGFPVLSFPSLLLPFRAIVPFVSLSVPVA